MSYAALALHAEGKLCLCMKQSPSTLMMACLSASGSFALIRGFGLEFRSRITHVCLECKLTEEVDHLGHTDVCYGLFSVSESRFC